MTLERDIVAIPFVGGIDTKTDAKSVLPTKLVDLQNGEFTEVGTMKKRPGYTELCQVTGAKAVGSRRDELLVATKQKLYSYNDIRNEAVIVGNYTCVTNEQTPINNANITQKAPDMATVGGATVVAYENGGKVYYSVYVGDQLAPYSLDNLARANSESPRVMAVGANIVVMYASTNSTVLYARVINVVDLSSLSDPEVTVISDMNATRNYDAIPYGEFIYLAYHTDGSGASTGLRLLKLNSSADDISGAYLDSTTTPALTSQIIDLPPAMDISDGYLHLSTVTDDAATYGFVRFYRIRLSDFSIANTGSYDTGGSTLDSEGLAICGIPSTSTAKVFYGLNGTIYVFSLTYDSATTTVSANITTGPKASFVQSQGWSDDTNGYVLLGNDSSSGLQYSTFIYRHDLVVLGRILYGEGPGEITNWFFPRYHELEDGTFQGATTYRKQLPIRSTTNNTGTSSELELSGIKRVVFDTNATPEFSELGESVYLNGSMVWCYDGETVSEACPLLFPEPITVAYDDPGSEALTNGNVYSWRNYYEWRKANGERVRSAGITVTSTVTGVDAKRAVITAKNLQHTNRTDVYHVVYRTETASQTGLYFRTTPNDPETTLSTYNVWNNSAIGTSQATIYDNLTDVLLAVREQDYQNTGELPNLMPNGVTHLGKAQGRLWLLGGADKANNLRFSKLRADGEPVAFNEALEITEAPEAGGKTVALSYINNTPVVFKERLIYGLAGDGPDNLGTNGLYNIQQISADMGCTDPGSVVPYIGGLLFKSAKGIYKLDQSFQLTYVGSDVEAYNSQTITKALAVPDSNQVIFLTDSGRTLLYDYQYNQWSTFTNHEGVSAAIWREQDYCYLRADGRVYKRTPDVYLDAGAPYKLKARTAPLRLKSALQGFWRVRKLLVLGDYKSPHRLKVRVFYDREAAAFETIEFDPTDVLSSSTWGSDATWGSGSVWGGNRNGNAYQFERKLKRQKCQTIAFEFSDVGADGASYEISEILLEVGLLPGPARLATVRKV